MGTSYVHDSQITFPKKKHGIHLGEDPVERRAVAPELDPVVPEAREVMVRNRLAERLPAKGRRNKKRKN